MEKRLIVTNETRQFFLSLVSLGIGHEGCAHLKCVDWQAIQALAGRQGLYAIALDGVEKLPANQRPPQMLLQNWKGEVLQSYEAGFEKYRSAVSELAKFYNSHGYKMMTLKGYACGLNWPKQEHRPYGGIDIWLLGKSGDADILLSTEKGILADHSHRHHTVFMWHDIMVENHYDFINVHHRRSDRELEAVFKELGKDDTHFVAVKGEKVYLPSPNLHALFLLKHAMNDFTFSSMPLRQLLDWAYHVEKHTSQIDWKWLLGELGKYHMLDFFNCINAICVGNLGFDVNMFPAVQFDPSLRDKILKDILEPEFVAEEPSMLIPRLIYKYKRCRCNAWKHELCYKENVWSAFWSGVWHPGSTDDLAQH